MKKNYLDFEAPISELEQRIADLRHVQDGSATDISNEIESLMKKTQKLIKDIYAKVTPWQITKIARHPDRPYAMDYIKNIFTNFRELHGDRQFADDPSLVAGLARFIGYPCVVIGQQKGRDIESRTLRNFGMSKPEGYRKALRVMELAQKFKLPIFTFVDTPGAYPGIDAEERGQSEAIGRNIFAMAQLEVPIVVTIIGEGGSGGALAIGVGDYVMMLQYAVYSVISPEGCASILWKTASKAESAAQELAITSARLKKLGLIDKVILEPIGGAHRNPEEMFNSVKKHLSEALRLVSELDGQALVEHRYQRLQNYGSYRLGDQFEHFVDASRK
ncbi:MAG: acetyl-CoA carboxylase carboxyltransferase subunit alpha [Gammaproteobacteria bacterium]|nr:acetyl-CoA carboxylase carboxyltransferase subunit alpha [Gammaproteobacteria bacterium]